MKEELKEYLKRIIKGEQKWMYHHDIDDEMFGVETDMYRWCKQALEGNVSDHQLLEYFTKYYPNDEKEFINKVKELMN